MKYHQGQKQSQEWDDFMWKLQVDQVPQSKFQDHLKSSHFQKFVYKQNYNMVLTFKECRFEYANYSTIYLIWKSGKHENVKWEIQKGQIVQPSPPIDIRGHWYNIMLSAFEISLGVHLFGSHLWLSSHKVKEQKLYH